jgi:hypothetical protein
MDDRLSSELKAAFDLLKGKPCWSVLAGAGTGSTVHLELGAAVPRRVPLRERPGITPEQARYEGAFDLFIECAWRLERAHDVLCGSNDDDRNDGPMVSGLGALVGKRVATVEVDAPVPDLSIRFDDQLRLKIFCDQTNLRTHVDNYSLRVGDTIYAVGPGGGVVIEKRTAE